MEEDFISLEDKMTCSVAPSQPLPPATPVIAQWTCDQRGIVSNDGGDFTHQGQPGLADATADAQSTRPEWTHCQGAIPWCDQPATKQQADYLGLLLFRKGWCSFFLEQTLTLDVDLPSLCTTLLPHYRQ